MYATIYSTRMLGADTGKFNRNISVFNQIGKKDSRIDKT